MDAELNLSDQRLQEMAGEIARDIYDLDTILKRFNVPPAAFDRLKTSRRFLAMLGEAMITWDSSTNIATRIRIKSEAMLEQMLADGYAYYKDARYPLGDKVKLLQTVAKLAGAGEMNPGVNIGADAGRPSDRVQITINLHPHALDGSDARAVVIDQPKLVLPPSDAIEEPPELGPPATLPLNHPFKLG